MLHRLWRRLKRWRRVPLGPVSLLYRLDRSVRVTQGPRLRRSPPASRPPLQFGGAGQPVGGVPARVQRAVIVGVGPGFGYALARRLAAEGFALTLVCRDAARLAPLLKELHAAGVAAVARGVDATDESGVERLFAEFEREHGSPDLVVYAVQYFSPGLAAEVEVPAFEAAWRHNCFGAFLVARLAARLMQRAGHGTLLLIGSTSSVIGRAEHLNLAVGKFGQRALAQVLARELWPQGIHVAHVIIDADIHEEDDPRAPHAQADPGDIAGSLLYLHRQPRSAWTSELDLRPWNERFWEHC